MHRLFGPSLILAGIVAGWWLGKPIEPKASAELSPAAAWRHYRAEQQAARVFKHDIAPHPAWVAAALATASLGVLLAAAPNRRQALAAAVWLRAHPSVRWN
jgi:hypothetical protein